MPATSAPFGMRPSYHQSGLDRGRAYPGAIVSTYGTAILKGQPVLLTAAGALNPVAANNVDFLGVFAGVQFNDAFGKPTYAPNWPAGQVATNIVPWVWDDPETIFDIQADGSVAFSQVGDQVNFSNFAAGSTMTGLSQCTCTAASVGTGAQGQLRVIELYQGVDNAWGDAFTILAVKIARSQYYANKVAL